VLAEGRYDGVFDAARHATARRRLAAEHVATLRAGLPDGLPLVLQPYLFARAEGRRATRQVATSLAGELG
jgi:hypothetical protein